MSIESSGPGVARIAASVPAANPRARLNGAVEAYFSSFGAKDVAARLGLFADDVVFEDPAGRLIASDRAGLRAFWVDRIPADWDVSFVLERVAIVGDEALATATMRLRAGDKSPVEVLVNCHLVFDAAARIERFRAFFDAESIIELPGDNID